MPGSGSSTTYTVVSGDSGDGIAQRYGISFDQLSAANPGVNWDDLQIGQTLNIPGSTVPTPVPTPLEPIPEDLPAIQLCRTCVQLRTPELWEKFSLMWNTASQAMQSYDTDQQIGYIQQAINTVAAESRPQVDRRVFLCVIMQESGGNVHVSTTYSPDGVRNPGLMQSHNGAEFDENNAQSSILQMVRDGTTGTPYGDGLTQLLRQYGDIYSALRGYNSGSVNPSNLSDGLGATNSYVSDMANRLLGANPN